MFRPLSTTYVILASVQGLLTRNENLCKCVVTRVLWLEVMVYSFKSLKYWHFSLTHL